MAEQAKFHPSPCIKARQRHENGNPKGHRERIAHIGRTKVKSRFAREILTARIAASMHLRGAFQMVGVGMHKKRCFPTTRATASEDPNQFGHVQTSAIPRNRRGTKVTEASTSRDSTLQQSVILIIGVDAQTLDPRLDSLFERPTVRRRIERKGPIHGVHPAPHHRRMGSFKFVQRANVVGV